MNLAEFLDFNQDCPVCGEPLTLYAQISDGPLWKARKPTPSVYHFDQFKGANPDFTRDDFFWVTKGNTMTSNTGFDIDFSSSRIYQNSKTWEFFFFFMCSDSGIEDAPRENYAINPCTACYYRSSPFLEFQEKEEGHWRLSHARGTDPIPGGTRDEILAFRVDTLSGGEKMYLLNIDHEANNMTMQYYNVSEKEKYDTEFEPNFLQLKLPIPKVRPNFDLTQRERLISRFDSWILMS